MDAWPNINEEQRQETCEDGEHDETGRDEGDSDDAVWKQDGPMKEERQRIEKLTVPSLKDELKACDASRKGKKPELVERLLDATKAHWTAHGTILSTTTNIIRSQHPLSIRSASNDEDEPVPRAKGQSAKGQLYDRGMINKMAASFSPAR